VGEYDGYESVKVTVEDGILTCTLNRGEQLNAYTPDVIDEIDALTSVIAGDDAVRVVVLTGAGRAFSAGGNVAKMDSGDTDVAAIIRRSIARGGARGFGALPQPTIAWVNGDAVGGGVALALACDIIVASASARVGFAYSRIGLSPSGILVEVLPLLMNLNRAKEYLFTGELIEAHEAERLGLFNHVYPDSEASAHVYALARRIAAGAPTSLRWAKVLVNKELQARAQLIGTAAAALQALSSLDGDFREGARAFVERRAPNFTGA
jgi:enoyl-CoA hydratase/carnithine racemase